LTAHCPLLTAVHISIPSLIILLHTTTLTDTYPLSLHDALPIFKAPWMPDRTEANPNELNQDDARYGFRCCHLKNITSINLIKLIDRKSGSAGCRDRSRMPSSA